MVSASEPRRRVAPGETVLDALAERGLPRVVRSVRYHRPRAPFCGTGDCTGCLVRADGRPNVRACRLPLSDGARVEPSNGWPTPRFDVLGAADLLLPHGIDTLAGFRRPSFARRFYQRVIRRLAGYSRAPDEGAATTLGGPVRRADVDTVVVGAGPAGRAAAGRLVAAGRRPLVIDRDPEAGGADGADLWAGATATFLPPPVDGERPFALLGYEGAGRGWLVRARTVVLATGCYDAALWFGGNDRPGIVAAELALRWSRDGRRSPLRRPIVVGGGPRAGAVLDRVGSTAVAVVAAGEISPEIARRASELGIPLYPRSLVTGARGRDRIRRLDLAGRSGGTRFSLACDSVVLAHRRVPAAQLAVQAGAAVDWASSPGANVPRATPGGATSVPGLYVAGSVGGADGPAESGRRAAEGLLAGTAPAPTGPPAPAPTGEWEGYFGELLRQPRRGKWIACPCEDVLLEEVERAVARGYTGVEVVKRYTGLGTGLCQGRYCLPDALVALSVLERRTAVEVGRITQRPPAVPTPLAALAALAPEFSEEVVP